MKKSMMLLNSTVLLAAGLLSNVALANNTSSNNIDNLLNNQTIISQYHINPNAIKMAVKGYDYAKSHHEIDNSNYLTIVDFTKPSKDKRLFVINLKNDQVVMSLRVANGKNSGLYKATRFSNRPDSDQSSLGVYSTGHTYFGEHGLSLRINGLEKGVNSNARARAVVVHPANYVTPAFVESHGYVGRSWGCFAVNPTKSHQLINLIKNGSVIFAYAPQELHDTNLVA